MKNKISMTTTVSVHNPSKLALCSVLLSSLLSLTACQDSNEVQDEANQAPTDTTTESINGVDNSAENNNPNYEQQSVEIVDVETTEGLEVDPNDTAVADQSNQAESDNQPLEGSDSGSVADNSPPASEIQVTDVEYQDSKGRSIQVTFQTSATATLQADLMLPSGKRVLLTAPTGQGNNPSYRSTDGSIELITHGGGASIDLLYQGQRTKFDAVQTDAEILKPQ